MTVLNALPRGAFKVGEVAESFGGEDVSDAEGAAGVDGHGPAPATGWTPALRDCWQSHVASATTSQVNLNLNLVTFRVGPNCTTVQFAASQAWSSLAV